MTPNAFKYCTPSSEGDAYIFMKLEVQLSSLVIIISNIFQRIPKEPALHSGIGLQNLSKRMKHYYPGTDSSMEIKQTGSIYQVVIHLKLKESN